MIDSLVSSPAIKLLENTLSFTEQRHKVILQNIANVSTPGYVQQDLSTADFQSAMQKAVKQQRQSVNDDFEPQSNESVNFSPDGTLSQVNPMAAAGAMPFHDRGVRTMESMMGDLADNAMAHNAVAQMLKNRYDIINKAISMKP